MKSVTLEKSVKVEHTASHSRVVIGAAVAANWWGGRIKFIRAEFLFNSEGSEPNDCH